MSESKQANSPALHDHEIDLRDLVRLLWVGKWLIGVIVFAASAIAVIVALMLPNIYSAEALLAPNQQSNSGGIPGLASQYAPGLAALTGISLNSGPSDKTAVGLEILKSRKFISEFIERHALLVPIMAAKGWDPESDKLIIDSDLFDVVNKKWLRNVRPPRQIIPSNQEAYDEFRQRVLKVGQDQVSGLVTITVEHYSPTIAKQWVDWLVEDINETTMRQDVAEAEQAIDYLSEQIAATSLADLQSVFFELIEEQTKTVMLANVSNEYLLKTIDPAVAPERRSKPNRVLIVLASAFSSALIASLLIILLGSRESSRQ